MSLPSQRNLTASVQILINGQSTKAVLDTAAMVTLVRDDVLKSVQNPRDLGSTCVLKGIGSDPVHGRMVHNVPITIGTQTFLHTVCVAPVKDTCLLGLDFMVATASVLDLGNEILKIDEDIIPISVTMPPEQQFSKVTVVRRTVVQPNTVGFVKAQLDKPIKGPYIVEGCPTKHTLASRIYGEGDQVTLKIVNDSEDFVTFKKPLSNSRRSGKTHLLCQSYSP